MLATHVHFRLIWLFLLQLVKNVPGSIEGQLLFTKLKFIAGLIFHTALASTWTYLDIFAHLDLYTSL